MDVNRLEFRGPQQSNAAVDKTRRPIVLREIPDWLKDIIGPMPPGSPGPTFPEPELDELVTDIMVDILLEQQFEHRESLKSKHHCLEEQFLPQRRKPENRLEGAVVVGGLIIIVRKDHPLVIIDIDDLLENPAEYQGSDGDDIWDVLQGH